MFDRRGRILLVAAHPDDETIGAGAQLAGPLNQALILHLTDGAPRNLQDAHRLGFETAEEYAAERRRELLAAMSLAKIKPAQLACLGIPDQELTQQLPRAIRRLASRMAEIEPEIVLTHPYEGGHPDHDSTALAVFCAVALQPGTRPEIVEFTSYHNAIPARTDSEVRLCCGEFLEAPHCRPVLFELSPEEQGLKRAMYACFATQSRVLSQFQMRAEVFRPAPAYDFTRPPHAGRLYYEYFNWRMSSERWIRTAQEILRQIREGELCL